RYDRVVAGPAPRGAPGPAIDNELVGVLGHLGVEVVHEHPHGRLLWPAPAAQAGAARGADRAGTGQGTSSVGGIHDPSSSSVKAHHPRTTDTALGGDQTPVRRLTPGRVRGGQAERGTGQVLQQLYREHLAPRVAVA